ncbi:DUF697 domain-containing protein [Paeniroseomonas aquatica]|uniref:DUF697 domain-containing protein n=1 Tax=Paeniroseomonas aquatica TaxID=373043 RepID=UPI00361E4309
MSDAPKGPRIIVEDAAVAPRLDFQWEQAVVPVAAPKVPSRWSGLGRAAAGAAVLGLGLAALDATISSSTSSAAARSRAGRPRGGCRGLRPAGLRRLAGGAGLFSIRAVERARAAFAREDLPAARAEALRWAGGVAEAASLQPALRQAGSTGELRALLEGGPLLVLDAQAVALGRAAAVQSFAVTAVSPSPGLDALVFTWRGVRLVRQVAALHGLRPGLLGTMALLRRTLLDAATVAATDVAVDAAARALLSNKLLEQFAGEAAAGAVAARRMLRLSKVAAEACRIVPPTP